jgi:hypothetical protein
MKNKTYVGVAHVRDRYKIADRTVDRWVASEDLPKPIYIKKRRYWSEDDLDRRDAARQGAGS